MHVAVCFHLWSIVARLTGLYTLFLLCQLLSFTTKISFLPHRFVQWPEEALLSVSKSFFAPVEALTDDMKTKVSTMCVEIHTSVNQMAER